MHNYRFITFIKTQKIAGGIFFLLFLGVFSTSCSEQEQKPDINSWKEEITNTEKAFAQMAADSGISKAFLHFAAEEAVLMRNDSVIQGKSGIQQYFLQRPMEGVSLQWSPDFVDVAASGDLGYTYGKFTFSVVDSSGNTNTGTGIFHTVWKRQPDGEWKYVWD